jgi:Flp pilus assembly protein TadD
MPDGLLRPSNCCRVASRDSPDQPDLLYEAALLAERLARYDDMEANLVRLIAVKPEHAHAYNALGYSFAERNIRLAESERLLGRALELAPNDPFIIDSMGWLLFRKGDLAGAAEQLRRALMLRPDPEISAHLGEVLWLKGEREEAARTWREAAQRHPDNEVLNNTIKRFLP